MTDKDADTVVSATSNVAPKSRVEQQMKKLKDANVKYKDLLKLAKERIQSQEENLEHLKGELKRAKEDQLDSTKEGSSHGVNGNRGSASSGFQTYLYDLPNLNTELSYDNGCGVVRVLQRIKMEIDESNDIGIVHENRDTNNDNQEESSNFDLWALIEYEMTIPETSEGGSFLTNPITRFLRWRRFRSESALSDHIRRDSGEPVSIPPYSLSPKQSQQIEEESQQAVAHVTEEFRRFRVRAEVARKQADATVRALQNNNVQTAQRHIEGQDIASELAQARTDHEQLSLLKAEMAEQEAHWKSAYDVLLAENNQLKSSGSEALLAAQWRQRYESCLTEKEKLETALDLEKEKSGKNLNLKKKEDSGKYEAKYKDLKESFRLYRKKAKEIFEAQQKGDTTMLNLVDNASDDAKISYLRNLMVNYLSSDPAVRDHMEGAIGTVLKFSREDCARISKQKNQSDASWF